MDTCSVWEDDGLVVKGGRRWCWAHPMVEQETALLQVECGGGEDAVREVRGAGGGGFAIG